MASWMAFDSINSAVESDSTLCWPMSDRVLSQEDALSHDHLMFSQFTNLHHGLASSAPSFDNLVREPATQPRPSGANLVHHPSSSSSSSADRPASSTAVSSTDEPDLLPSANAEFPQHSHHPLPPYSGLDQPLKRHIQERASSSSLFFDSTLQQRFGEVSLHSPVKMEATAVVSHSPISPTPRSVPASRKQPKKIVDAISSTFKKATQLRKGKKQAQPVPERSASPTLEHPPMAIKKERFGGIPTGASTNTASSVPLTLPYNNAHYSQSANFIHGYCDDPFGDFLQSNPSVSMGFLDHHGNGVGNHLLKNGQETSYHTTDDLSPKAVIDMEAIIPDLSADGWHSQQLVATSLAAEQWAGSAVAGYAPSHEPEWWEGVDVFESKNAQTSHHALQVQQLDLPYHTAYDFAHPVLDDGVMVSLPPPPATIHEGQAPVQQQQAYPPPPPPPPAPSAVPTTKERGRSSRPPKARSSGARHQNTSPSPMRKTRGPSASPKPIKGQSQPLGQTSAAHQRRHSSTGSISSARSASGRVTGASAPGTPGGHGIRKRRSRDTGLLCSTGGDDMGFVNFTPNDGSLLMTGVAPSGSSKTKARREKEAQERRRKLSEAAMKAVVAAGGDVDKLIQEGFVF